MRLHRWPSGRFGRFPGPCPPGRLRDGIDEYEARFAPVKELLPDFELVGYLQNPPDNGARFFLAQYAMAPVVLDDRGTDHHFVICNLFTQTQLQGDGWSIVKDSGNGVVLLSREAP